MATVDISCPKCRKRFRGNDGVQGKRIRCPHCSAAFVVKQAANGDDTPAPEPEEDPPENQKKPKSADLEEDANPYGVKTVSLAARCPNCANEMINATAIICVYCGYNTQTRSLGKTKRVVQQTGADKFKWLLPGVGSLVGVLLVVLLQLFYVVYLGPSYRIDASWISMLFSEPIYLWLTMILVGVIWFVGRVAFKRLIVEPTPPENVID